MSGRADDFGSMWQDFSRRIEETSARLRESRGAAPGCSPSEVVWRKDKATLHRYLPLAGVQSAKLRPLLICFALVNRPQVLDLQADRSLVRRLLAEGLEVYLLDWGFPDESDSGMQIADYLDTYLDGAVRHVLRRRRVPALNLLGVCQGGTFCLCYSALHPGRVANLVTMVTPVDFHTPADLLSKWARHIDMEGIRKTGNLPGGVLTGMFLSLRPFRLMHQKYVALLQQPQDPQALETFSRMERWIFESPDQAATAAAQFVRWLTQENRLVSGTLEIAGRRVDLGRIRQPVLNIYAEQDHIVPPEASRALRKCLPDTDYTELPIDTGHIGMYVSRASQFKVASGIATWLRARR